MFILFFFLLRLSFVGASRNTSEKKVFLNPLTPPRLPPPLHLLTSSPTSIISLGTLINFFNFLLALIFPCVLIVWRKTSRNDSITHYVNGNKVNNQLLLMYRSMFLMVRNLSFVAKDICIDINFVFALLTLHFKWNDCAWLWKSLIWECLS